MNLYHRPPNSIGDIKFIATLVLLLAYSIVAEQSERCDTDQQAYCETSESQGHEIVRHLKRDSGDNEQKHVPTECLRAGVVEYSRVYIVGDCLQTTQTNLENLAKIAEIANQNGVKMLVFPEDGISYGSARSIVPCLEEIPDPEKLTTGNNIPCDSQSPIYDDTPILRRLSCLAKQYDLYLIANYGTREPCDNKELSNDSTTSGMASCPVKDRDFLMLNTNVVFNPKGQFIKRYRKWHPFTESEIFDKAPKLEHIYFDSPYGRFGLFTCFDMIYRDPALDLVEDYHIDTAIFPTWWFDEAPILNALQYQDGWSSTNNVNLLAPNILKPSRGSTGSSIFSGNFSLYVSHSSGDSARKISRTKLLIANLAGRKGESTDETCDFNPKIVEIEDNESTDGYRYRHFALREVDRIVTLDALQDNKTVCSGQFCCSFDYQLAAYTTLEHMNRLALIVRDGQRAGLYQWYEQVCAVAILKEPLLESSKAGKQVAYDIENGAHFLKLSIRARFHTKYVYPSTAHDARNLIDRKQRRLACHETRNGAEKLHDCQLELSRVGGQEPIERKVYAFAMYARVYERDPK